MTAHAHPADQPVLDGHCGRCGVELAADHGPLEGGPGLGCRACNPCIPTSQPARGRRSSSAEGRAFEAAVERLARMDRERTPAQHTVYVEHVIDAIRPYLVLRSLHDQVVRELHQERGVPGAI